MRSAMKRMVSAALAAVGIVLPASAFGDESPTMDPDKPVVCARDKADQVWRIQCDPATRVCLFVENAELDENGNPGKPLERANDCPTDVPFDRAKLERDGFRFVRARADAPWGWYRDERNRVFQFNFDLRRRLYFGVAYSPRSVLENPLESTRTSIDFGLLVAEWRSTPTTRHRIRLFEGQVHMQPFSSEVVFAHYDFSHHFLDPLVRITTFVGTPARHDLHLDIGTWNEAGNLELHRTAQGNSQLWRHASSQLTLDLWQSPSLDSFVRLRTGLGLEGQFDDVNHYRSAMTASSALDIDVVLDPEGHHNLKFEMVHEIPHYFTPYVPDMFVQRMHARLQYEAIVLAINDQPVTLKLAAGGEKRNDIPGIEDRWAFLVDAGLRFSLWAPPRPRS
jgi:hypothetical protein